MAWQPLHVRLGVEEELYEGVPGHLQGPLWDWVDDAISRLAYISGQSSKAVMLYIGIMARLSLIPSEYDHVIVGQIQRSCFEDEVRFLSVIDVLLDQLCAARDREPLAQSTYLINQLDEYLLLGNSAWAVAPDHRSLTLRIDRTAVEAVAQIIAPHDAASGELVEAWRAAYGREPNPSDAWDHSIKAVEHILKPVVCPNNNKATLSNVVGDLRTQPQRWRLVLPGSNGDFSVTRLVSMLELIWPNPDRHGGSTMTVVTLEQARAVVHLAVTIVQWGRAGVLQRVP